MYWSVHMYMNVIYVKYHKALNNYIHIVLYWLRFESQFLFTILSLYPCRVYIDFAQEFAKNLRKHLRPYKVHIYILNHLLRLHSSVTYIFVCHKVLRPCKNLPYDTTNVQDTVMILCISSLWYRNCIYWNDILIHNKILYDTTNLYTIYIYWYTYEFPHFSTLHQKPMSIYVA